ncbi:MAG: hypothetical protein ABJF23_31735 [Bryobacteraceae bacterium]
MQIYAGPGNVAEDAKDITALISFWLTRLGQTMSRPQLALLYRDAQRDSPDYLRRQIYDFLKGTFLTDPPHWMWVALDCITARVVFVNLFTARVSSPLLGKKEQGPDPLSYLERFLSEPNEWPTKWAVILEEDIKRYGRAWYQRLVEHVEQRNDVGLWPPQVTTSQAERLEIILWILYERYIGLRPLLSDRETAHRLHLRVPTPLLDVPITTRCFGHETPGFSQSIDGMNRSSEGSVLSLQYEPLPGTETLTAVIANHRGWQIELSWNRLTLIACVNPGAVRADLAGANKRAEAGQPFGLPQARHGRRDRKYRHKRPSIGPKTPVIAHDR